MCAFFTADSSKYSESCVVPHQRSYSPVPSAAQCDPWPLCAVQRRRRCADRPDPNLAMAARNTRE